MNLSYWEADTFVKRFDFSIIGSGIVGLNAALRLRELHPTASICIVERGSLPSGASTKNAGFACFGSISELEDDLRNFGEDECLKTVEKRWKGLQILRSMHIDSHIDYRPSGGFEIFHSTDAHFEEHFSRIEFWNNRLKSIVGPAVFSVRSATEFSSSNIREKLIFNEYEGLLHPGKLISSLFEKARMAEIQFFFGMEVLSIDKDTADIKIYGKEFALSSGQVLLATNAFTTALLPEIQVSPARNQVLVTSEIDDLQLVGGYHLDRGYFYFRRIGDRILIGGGRQLDSKAETTSSFGTSELIMGRLEQMLREDIIPGKDFNIDYRWSGILGIGAQKSALVERINDRLSIGVRLGGMGVAIGSLVGRELAELCS